MIDPLKAVRYRTSTAQALVAVLLVLVFLTSMMGLVTTTLLVEARASRNQYFRHAALYNARAGLEVAAAQLLADDLNVDSAADAWYVNEDAFGDVAFGKGSFAVRYPDETTGAFRPGVVDEERKVNINTADADTLKGLHPALTDAVVEQVIVRRKTRPFAVVNELALLDGLDRDALRAASDDAPAGLASLLTVFGDGKVNVNTAPVAVLASLPGLDKESAQKIVDYREGGDTMKSFTTVDAVQKAAGLAAGDFAALRPLLTVASRHFSITAVGRVKGRDHLERELYQVVQRDAKGVIVLRFEQVK